MPNERSSEREIRNGEAGKGLAGREKEDFVEQVEEFEGPDRREKRGSEKEPSKEPGVARS